MTVPGPASEHPRVRGRRGVEHRARVEQHHVRVWRVHAGVRRVHAVRQIGQAVHHGIGSIVRNIGPIGAEHDVVLEHHAEGVLLLQQQPLAKMGGAII